MHWLIVISLLTLSNTLVTFAWYWHIKPTATPLPLWQIKPFQLKIL